MCKLSQLLTIIKTVKMLKEIIVIFGLISALICSPINKFIFPRDDCDYVDNAKEEFSQKSTEFWYQSGLVI